MNPWRTHSGVQGARKVEKQGYSTRKRRLLSLGAMQKKCWSVRGGGRVKILQNGRSREKSENQIWKMRKMLRIYQSLELLKIILKVSTVRLGSLIWVVIFLKFFRLAVLIGYTYNNFIKTSEVSAVCLLKSIRRQMVLKLDSIFFENEIFIKRSLAEHILSIPLVFPCDIYISILVNSLIKHSERNERLYQVGLDSSKVSSVTLRKLHCCPHNRLASTHVSWPPNHE